MHRKLRLGIKTDALRIESSWSGSVNSDLDPEQMRGEEGGRNLPYTVMREKEGNERLGTVRVEGRDCWRV